MLKLWSTTIKSKQLFPVSKKGSIFVYQTNMQRFSTTEALLFFLYNRKDKEEP
jgi:hypothetical protein